MHKLIKTSFLSAVKIHLSRKLGELRINQAELARRTNIRPNTINELYNECAKRIKFEDLAKICSALKCDISDIIELKPRKK